MSKNKLPDTIQQQVRQRAQALCEYCHAAEQWQYVPFTLDHIQPLSQGGSDSLENLALACFHCNRRKSNRTVVLDPETKCEVSLFHPRQQDWQEHFIWSGDGLSLVGLTPTGRATIFALDMNRLRLLAIRSADLTVGRHPPPGDRHLRH